jgi:alpha-tubulin suppressor-like RCC1 family protein
MLLVEKLLTVSPAAAAAGPFQLYAWGNNVNGEVGNNAAGVAIRSPIQIDSNRVWSSVGAGANHVLGVKSNGTLWTWGLNSSGQLGDGTVVSKSSPIQIGAGTTWSKAYGGNAFSCALKTDGTLWCWGLNTSGQVGDNTAVSKSSPVQIGNLTTWSMLALAEVTSFGLKTDGTLWSWGTSGGFGLLGINLANANRSSPVQIGTDVDWTTVGTVGNTAGAIKTGGTLYSWGNNIFGQCGLGNVANRSVPTQVGALTTWSKVVGNQNTMYSVKTDGTMWAWGLNTNGQVVDGTVVNKS